MDPDLVEEYLKCNENIKYVDPINHISNKNYLGFGPWKISWVFSLCWQHNSPYEPYGEDKGHVNQLVW